jgi:hypothetical protein
MGWKRRFGGGLLAAIGFVLSPLSWWNDLLVNLPLAVGFGWVVSLFHKPAFEVSVVLGYWLTNVLGFVLMHKGAETMAAENKQPYSRRSLLKDFAVSLLYTALIVALIKFGVLKPVQNYFGSA